MEQKDGLKKRKEQIFFFLMGAFLGCICFLAIYGIKVLDSSYTDWLFASEQDLYQHYIGWCHYRNTPWQFPIGMIDSLAKPLSVSIIWTDSIPLFALFFKLFSPFLPIEFQYFGFFGLFSFSMQGGFSALLIGRLTHRKSLGLLGALLCILSFPMLQRMFYHTALGSQWLIFLSLYVWLERRRWKGIGKICLIWAGIGALTVSLHSYFLPMTGILMMGMAIHLYLEERDKKRSLGIISSYIGGAAAGLWTWGAFEGSSSQVGEGLGTFSSNLNTFYNSQGHSSLLKGLPLYFDWQEEGFGYLGLGGLFLVGIMALFPLRRVVLVYKGQAYPSLTGKGMLKECKKAVKRHPFRLLLFLASFILFCYAVSPIVTWNEIEIIHVPLPSFVERMLNIFRSSGRLIWLPMYMIILTSIVFLHRRLRGRESFFLLLLAVLLQWIDIREYAMEKGEYFAKREHKYQIMWQKTLIDNDEQRYKGFQFMYTDNDILLPTAYYAYLKDMWVSNYYFARSYEEEVERRIEQCQKELLEGEVSGDVLYVFQEGTKGLENYPLHYTQWYGHIVGTRDKIDNGKK